MRKPTTLFFFLLLLAGASSALPAQEVTGNWWTEAKDTLIQISTDANGQLDGKIISGPKPDELDVHNPVASLRRRPLLGLVILHGFVKEAPLSWKDGQIYDPESGKTYKAIIRMKKNDLNHLSLKGYVGIPLFGRASEWTRASQ
ncbi:MAG: DUF2147 domain-containing protein [Holophaga sp.]|nr:DUF2147 domain-containing protein [Holophaga sp.]